MPYRLDPQPDTVINVHRAGPLDRMHVPVLRIHAVLEMPEVGSTPASSMLDAREIFKADGRALADALAQHLPGGTLNELVIRLLDITKSSLLVPAHDGEATQ